MKQSSSRGFKLTSVMLAVFIMAVSVLFTDAKAGTIQDQAVLSDVIACN